MKHLLTVLLTFACLICAPVQAAEEATITADELVKRLEHKDADLVVLDVRTPEEFAAGHIAGAVNIPHDQLPTRLSEIVGAKDREVVIYCRSGRRSAIAQDTLASQGFKRVRHLEGDMLKWQAEQRPLER